MTACMSCALGPGRFISQSGLEYISLTFNTGRLSTAAHRTAAGAVVLTPALSASGAAAPVMPPAPAWRGRSRFVQVPPSATSSQVEVGPWIGRRAQRQASLLLSRRHHGGLGIAPVTKLSAPSPTWPMNPAISGAVAKTAAVIVACTANVPKAKGVALVTGATWWGVAMTSRLHPVA